MFKLLYECLGESVKRLDYLIALARISQWAIGRLKSSSVFPVKTEQTIIQIRGLQPPLG